MPKSGYKQSKEHKNNISNSHKGKVSKLKNKTYKEIYGEEKSNKLKLLKSKVMKGIIPWNKNLKIIKEEYPTWGMTGKKCSENTKQKISIGNLNKIILEKIREKISNSHKGKIHTIEHNKNVSNGLMGHEVTNETREKISKTNLGHEVTKETREKIKIKCKESCNKPEYKKGLIERRKLLITPKKDTTIEVIIQNYLKQLNIEFLTHQYMHIEHGYQCDILIPVQEGIDKKTIIECFGIYWHNYPNSREVDILRCNELRKQGWRVLIFWENEIRVMQLNDLQTILK